MLHDHINILRWSLKGLSFIHCIPIEWDNSAQRVIRIKKRGKLAIAKTVQNLQLGYLGLMTLVLYKQNETGCLYTLLPNICMWLITVTLYSWGMGFTLAYRVATLLNTTTRFEQWLQNTFEAMNILQESRRSITNRNQRNTILRRVLPFLNIMGPLMFVARMRRLLGNHCNPVYLGYLLGYCSSCQEHLVSRDDAV
ncbi:hypothetical protein Fcan01_23146 [Folsomia candida]|uniref:Uncharacterized protein n=1 Tax=Folsomia candida TaxID=158441 RepID=A0A226D9U3_FOLCA|nr:hypothetical protein Fcan01_23146 [Folsomia candida]